MSEPAGHSRASARRFALKDWAAVAEIVASVAVVISLLFVAQSIRRNTQELRVNHSNLSYEALREVSLAWATSEHLSSAMRRFEREGRENLTEAQSDAVDEYGLMIVSIWEQHWVRYLDGIIPEADYRDWEAFYRANTTRYLGRERWQHARWSFDSDFVGLVDRALDEGTDS